MGHSPGSGVNSPVSECGAGSSGSPEEPGASASAGGLTLRCELIGPIHVQQVAMASPPCRSPRGRWRRAVNVERVGVDVQPVAHAIAEVYVLRRVVISQRLLVVAVGRPEVLGVGAVGYH